MSNAGVDGMGSTAAVDMHCMHVSGRPESNTTERVLQVQLQGLDTNFSFLKKEKQSCSHNTHTW